MRGALLDSIADIVFLAIIAFKLVSLVFKILPNWSIVVCIIITIVKVMVYLVGYIKFHCFVALHTILNKVMGIVLFLSMYIFMIVEVDIIIVFFMYCRCNSCNRRIIVCYTFKKLYARYKNCF